MSAKYDDRTAKGWPLPHKANRLYDDVERLREALTLIDETITAVETHEGTIEGRQDSIDTRLDTILEGATDDAEILDARVDAEDEVHPNLGHNIRNLHRLIRELNEALNYESSEFQGLLRQFGAIAEAQIHNELNAQDAHERRKLEIQQEALTRLEQDYSFQRQVNAASDGIIRLALALQDLSEKRRKDSKREEQSRISRDEDLQAQIDRTAEAGIDNTLNIHQEAEQRRKSDERIEALKEESGRQNEVDDYHQQQIDAAILSILRNILTLSETLSRGRKALHREVLSRFEEDSGIQSQANTNAEAVMRNTLNIQDEADKRRQLLSRLIEEKHDREHAIQDLRAEIGTLYEIPLPGLYESLSWLQEESDKNAEAGIHNALNLHEEAERRREISGRIEAVSLYFQWQIDELLHAILENAVNLHDEVIRRKSSENEERLSRFNEDTALQTQIDTAVQGILRNTLILSETLSRQREALKQEAITRTEQDAGILSQVNQLAIANMWLAVQEHETRRKVNEMKTDIEAGIISIPGRAATDEEFDEMLDGLYKKT